MTASTEKPRRFFYLLWILLTLLCIPIAFFLDVVILRIVSHFIGDFIYVDGVRHITEDYLGMYTFFPIVGLLMGLAQYGLLRRHLPRMGWWVLATLSGWLLGFILVAIPTWLHWTDGSNDLDFMFILMGLAIGVAQWLLLRRRLSRAIWWIGANVVGWGLSGLVTAGNTLDQFGLFTLGLFSACATAAALAWLMNRV